MPQTRTLFCPVLRIKKKSFTFYPHVFWFRNTIEPPILQIKNSGFLCYDPIVARALLIVYLWLDEAKGTMPKISSLFREVQITAFVFSVSLCGFFLIPICLNKQWEVIALEQLTSDIEGSPPTTETRVAYDNSTWHAITTRYINHSTKETSYLFQSGNWR